MDDRFIFSSTSYSLFDTYLVYGIISLLTMIAFVGLIILLATSCCCSVCCYSRSNFCYLPCFHHHSRHSSYRLRQNTKPVRKLSNHDRTTLAYVKRHASDVANFSHLYESCPHLVNSKAMNAKLASNVPNMETSCTTIDTLISPLSPCSSFRSFGGSVSTPNQFHRRFHKLPTRITMKYVVSISFF